MSMVSLNWLPVTYRHMSENVITRHWVIYWFNESACHRHRTALPFTWTPVLSDCLQSGLHTVHWNKSDIFFPPFESIVYLSPAVNPLSSPTIYLNPSVYQPFNCLSIWSPPARLPVHPVMRTTNVCVWEHSYRRQIMSAVWYIFFWERKTIKCRLLEENSEKIFYS